MTEVRKLLEREFPPLLSEMPDPPHSLYMRGSLPPPGAALLSVVGSRRMSAYGKEACERLIAGLAGYPISIVSGLALGIDGVAHTAALKAGLHTLAIPGSGLDDSVLYPRSHHGLAREILKASGGLLSEEPPLFRARPESFPKRNRIMAGISRATLVVEASIKSGTLITARLALDYNRELLAVPHPIFSESGAGGHLFMKLGAAPVRSTDDILEALRIEPATSATAQALDLSPNEERVLGALVGPLPRDEIIRTLGMSTAEANALLLSMELRGLIQETLGAVRKVI